MGNPQMLIGEFLGTWFTWDAIRALGYLLTRRTVSRMECLRASFERALRASKASGRIGC